MTPRISFFLEAIIHQADKNIRLINDVNKLYDHDLDLAQSLINSSGVKKLIDAIYQRPIFTVHTISSAAEVSEANMQEIFIHLRVEQNYFFRWKTTL